MREPILVLSANLRVRRANRSFYRTFRVTPKETVDRLVYDLGHRQWDIPSLRKLLAKVLPQNTFFDDFEVVHEFDSIGQKVNQQSPIAASIRLPGSGTGVENMKLSNPSPSMPSSGFVGGVCVPNKAKLPFTIFTRAKG